ncbi:hypothetical protein B0H17DRAFT_1288256 [Mycena rosella]|uniref:C3H1-type domain-containing protein n=1 Tax=Mycena rosella TaxID=1033263 RepID=A0AAD7BMP8_MYCRO|nr:hypothetical protein B0H17DRAFT_1288256 [Mycena rosella]
MPAHPSKVSDAYAARTPCLKHYHVFPGEARGSMRHHTYSECEMTGPSGASCRYSHDIPVYAKKQSMCLQHGSASGCPRGANCPYDHDLIDGERIQGLAKHNGGQGMTADLNYLKVDCVIGPSGDVLWRITMLPEGCKGLPAALQGPVPARPFTCEGTELLDVVRRLETLLHITVFLCALPLEWDTFGKKIWGIWPTLPLHSHPACLGMFPGDLG